MKLFFKILFTAVILSLSLTARASAQNLGVGMAPTESTKSPILAEAFYRAIVESPYDNQRRALNKAVHSLLHDGYNIEESVQPIRPPNGKIIRTIFLEKLPGVRQYKLTVRYVNPTLRRDSSPMQLEVTFIGIVHDEDSALIDHHPVILNYSLTTLVPVVPMGGVTGSN